jgi:hypothetical protein
MMNFNLTYGMAVSMRKIQDRIDLNETNEWEDEKIIEQTKTEIRRQTIHRQFSALEDDKKEEEDVEEFGFYF